MGSVSLSEEVLTYELCYVVNIRSEFLPSRSSQIRHSPISTFYVTTTTGNVITWSTNKQRIRLKIHKRVLLHCVKRTFQRQQIRFA